MERWDAPYRGERLPGWDVGRPCSHLVRAVEDTTFKPGRAIVLGCGSGTNAIYLASKGFEVTGVDVSPTALAIAAEKARKADVEVDWMVADVSALPKRSRRLIWSCLSRTVGRRGQSKPKCPSWRVSLPAAGLATFQHTSKQFNSQFSS